MFLTILIPTISNKELTSKLSKEKKKDDELLYFKVKSADIREIMNSKVTKAKHDNMLIINSSDPMCMKNGFIDMFRKEGVVVSNTKEDGLSKKSSIKFLKKDFKEVDLNTKCLNLKDYINIIYDTVEGDIEELDTKEQHLLEVKEQKRKPKILFISDVKGWAWWIKSHYIKKYLSNEFDIDIINVIGEKKQRVDTKKYDLYFTYGYSYIHYIKQVPFQKRITGLTAHRNLKLLKPKLKQAYAIHANSKLLMNEAKQVHNNIFYVPNGVDTELFYKHQESDILDRKIINVGHVGKNAKLKQQKTVIEPVVKKLGKDYNYLHHYNDFTNRISHEDMPQLYQNMDLFIVASIEDGTPNPALEAMACEVPIISNKIGNMPEIIVNGYNGYLIDNPTIDNYVKLIKSLSREHILEMGKNARKSILEGWTWEIQAENYRHMFRTLLGK